MARLPLPGSDEGTWGQILNDYLGASHAADGTLKANTVGTAQLQLNSVTNTQLAPGAVTVSEIQDGTISEAKLTSAVTDKLNATSSGGSTNLSASTAASAVTVTSDTGTDATIPAATTSAAGVLSASDKTKLDGVAAGAQVNTVSSVSGKTGAVTLTKADVGLTNVDNTSDANKPISSATQSALDAKANTSHTHTLDSLSDVTITSPTVGQVVKYNGSAWVNDTDATAGGAGSTNLSASTSASNVTVASDTGTDATIPAATTSAAGALTAADKTKLDSVASGATANSSDAQLRDRSTHTGTQPISSVANLQAELDGKLGEVTLADVPPGSAFYVIRSGANWTYGGANVVARPTSRTDLVMHLLGGLPADRPAWAIPNDIHLADSAA